jgi:hypothetical protein
VVRVDKRKYKSEEQHMTPEEMRAKAMDLFARRLH